VYVCVYCDGSELVESLLDTMQQSGADFTNTFRSLSRLSTSGDVSNSVSAVKSYLTRQCATLDELRNFYSPNMDPQ